MVRDGNTEPHIHIDNDIIYLSDRYSVNLGRILTKAEFTAKKQV